ncbi:unnamed protein product [Lymnaea stagnalis]|uniref:G-protein coupled receptors family 1 profile domain-containing protein n=1 Tax=Lymnaea stagnalis TaxID=6523 RepID=A0AAV2H180_LYMST
MDHVNSNYVPNATHDGVTKGRGVTGHDLEAYTVVLSVAAHLLSMLFGGGSSVTVIIAITTRRNINKYSYTLVLTLFLACCCLNFVWSPLEIADLIMYHYVHRHPCGGFLAVKTAAYIFLVLVLGLVIVLLSAEGIVRMKNKYGRVLRKLWPLLTCVFVLFLSAFLTAVFATMCSRHVGGLEASYVLEDGDARSTFLALVTFAFGATLLTLAALGLVLLKEMVYWEDGRPHFRQKNMKLTIPEFLISQSNACADNDGGFEPSQSGTPSPSTPKLLMVSDPDTASIKGEDANTISELPSPIIKPMGNRLGINMAQVLGRRRHTICQISDSSNVSTPADPISKAKQYNYVRKFSVDISALQAQLQNPKIFKDAPFQSDIDLTKRSPAEGSKPAAPRPLLPLKPLSLKFDEKEERVKTAEDEKHTKEPGRAGLNIPPPPMITVSNEDTQSNHLDMDMPSDVHGSDIPNDIHGSDKTNDTDVTDIQIDIHGSRESFHQQTKLNSRANSVAQKPTSLAFKDTTSTEEHVSVPTLESAQSDPSDTESEGQKMARLTLLMCLTFVLNMLPVFITEALQTTLSRHAFINISTCTLAVSAIQTIVYPHLIACSDDVVHRAVHKLKLRLRNVCSCGTDRQSHCQVEESSSTSQV